MDMKNLKATLGQILQGVTQVLLMPLTLFHAVRQIRAQMSLNEKEIERLDRIRNPSKYLGK